MAYTIYDISREAGVSPTTVSRVLNGNDKVKPETREKILEVIRKHNFAPNASARAMSVQSTKTIGILCPYSFDPFYAKAVYCIEQELQAHGYDSLICNTGYDLDIQKNYINLIVSKKIDALILVGSNFVGSPDNEKQYLKDASAQMPIMLMNAVFNHPNVYSILSDDFHNVFEATETMIESGIHDIIYIYNSTSYSGVQKLNGFKAAMQKHQITDYEKLIHKYNQKTEKYECVAQYMDSILSEGQTFHGIISSNDEIAIGCLKYAQSKGIRIPDELSIVGYNNSIITDYSTPELSSIDNCLDVQAHMLVQTLLGVFAGEEMPQKTVISGKLVKRGSTSF